MRTLSIYGQLNNKSFASSEDFDGLVSSDDAKVVHFWMHRFGFRINYRIQINPSVDSYEK